MSILDKEKIYKVYIELFVNPYHNISTIDCEVLYMALDWMTPQQIAGRWSITDRRVQALCAKGQIDGAVKLGHGWLIPKATPKPKDGRAKNGRVAAKDKIESKG